MPRWKGHTILLILALYPVGLGATDLSQCLSDVKSCANNSSNCPLNMSNTTAFSILRTSQGRNVASAHDATALSYTGCTQYCGTGTAEFSWNSFAQAYAAWLLPSLALLSQLPFGAQRRMDNLMSAVLTLGSPTLAAYSLYMTLLNARWVNDQLFSGIDYPSAVVRQSVVRVLSGLQQVPLRIHPAKFESLVVLPGNDNWWMMLAEELDYSRNWSIASATSFAWVVIAYLLTVTDSIYHVPDNFESSGQATGSVWLWLLSIVVGWLVLSPKCDYTQVHDAYLKANRQAFVADSEDRTPTPTSVTSDTSNFGLTISPNPNWLFGGDIVSPDELRTPPVFNYARIFSWRQNVSLASSFYRAAWRKSSNHVGRDGRRITGKVPTDVPSASRSGTREQIIDGHKYTAANVLWPRGLFRDMIVASLMSLLLQWGTTGAAFLAVWFTPPTGLGCRSLAYLIYGALSTAVWMLLVLSSALGYYAHHLLHDPPALDLERDPQCTTPGVPSGSSSYNPTANPTDGAPVVSPEQTNFAVPVPETHAPNGWQAERKNVQPDKRHLRTRWIYGQMMSQVADWLRWIAKFLAIINAIGIIANSIFQYAGLYTSCYCDSSVFSWGASAFNVIQPNSNDIHLARNAWVGGLALALSCCSIFVGSIYLVRDTLPQ